MMTVSRPVRQGRAPLRQALPVPRKPGDEDVVPSAKDGLHCGDIISGTSPSLTLVVPSAKDGLHCGRVNAHDTVR